MAKKTFKPPRIAPLQRVTCEPITDPDEQAAIDKMRKRLKRKQSGQQAKKEKKGKGKKRIW